MSEEMKLPSLKEIFHKTISDSTSWSLIFTNILIIIVALAQNWNIDLVISTYFIQSLFIGLFSFLRILNQEKIIFEKSITKEKGEKELEKFVKNNPFKTKLFIGLFFAFQYFVIHLVYYIFLGNSLFSALNYDITTLGIIFFILFNHGYSFSKNLRNDKCKPRTMKQLMTKPMYRVLPIHLIVAMGLLITLPIEVFAYIKDLSAASAEYFSNITILLFFLFIKTYTDLVMHIKEHSEKN